MSPRAKRWQVTVVNDRTGGSKKVTVVATGIDKAMDYAERQSDPYGVDPWYAIHAEEISEEISARANPGAAPRRNKADAVFQEWHKKEPRKDIGPVSVRELTQNFACIGKCDQILYDSDKWEKDGDLHPYYHDTTSRPGVWIPANQVDDDERIGREKAGSSLVGSRGGALWLAQLAFCTGLTYQDKLGEKVELQLPGKSKMLSTADKKGVLILTRKGPIIVRGGQMRVTARGLVK